MHEIRPAAQRGGNSPLDPFHSAFLPKPRPRIGKCTAKYRDAVVHSAGIPMKNFLSDERPPVYLLRRRRRNSTAALVRDMDVFG